MHTYYLPFMLLIVAFTIGLSESKAKNIPTDTLLTHLYDQAASLMEEGAYDSAQTCFNRAFATEGVKKSAIYPILLNEQATLYFYVGQLARSLDMKKSVLPYLPQIEDLEKHVSVYNDLGVLYHRFNQQDSSLYYYNKALDAAQAYGDKSWIGNLSLNLAVFYFNLRQYDDAEKHVDHALKNILQTDDANTTFATWQVRSAIKAQIGKTEESGTSIRQAWKLACGPEGRTEWKVRCIPSLYRYFQRKGMNDSIRHYIDIGNKLLKELPANNVSATGFIQTRGLANYEQKRYTEALKDFIYLYNQPTGSEKKSLFEKMATCYYHTGNAQKAFAYMDSARMWSDSLAQQKVTSQMAELKVKYQTQEKELEIALLNGKILKQETDSLKIAIALISGLALLIIIVIRQRHKQKNAERKLLQMKQEKELEATQSYIEGMEEECRYFAKELHDGIANDLLALEMKARLEQQEPIAHSIKRVRENVRTISHELIPPEFDHLTLDEILRQYARHISENTGIHIDYNERTATTALPANWPDRIAREVYRITQEVTMNIIKHTDASRIDILFTADADENICLQITDNGKTNVSTHTPQKDKGIGLRTISDRAKALCATIETRNDEKGNHFILNFKLHPYE